MYRAQAHLLAEHGYGPSCLGQRGAVEGGLARLGQCSGMTAEQPSDSREESATGRVIPLVALGH
jgi:hypothetical protein